MSIMISGEQRMKFDFVGRTQELEVLDALWRKDGAQLLVL